jgi:hypothetical protein
MTLFRRPCGRRVRRHLAVVALHTFGMISGVLLGSFDASARKSLMSGPPRALVAMKSCCGNLQVRPPAPRAWEAAEIRADVARWLPIGRRLGLRSLTSVDYSRL